MRETLRRLVAFVEPGHRAAWMFLVVMTLLVTVLEIVAASLVFSLTHHIADVTTPLTIPWVGDPRAWVPLAGDRGLIVGSTIIAVFFLLRAGVVLVLSYLRARVAERTGMRLSSRLFRGYLRMPYAFHLQRRSSELIRNVNDSVKAVVDHTLLPTLRIASDVMVIIGLSVAVMVMAPVAALLSAVLFVPLIALMFGIVQPRIAVLGRTSHDLGQSALASLQQSLHGFREITILGRAEHFQEQYERIREEIGRARYLRHTLADIPRVVLETGLILFVTVFITVAAAMGHTTAESLGILAVFAYTALRVLPSVNRVVLQLNDLKYGAAAAAAVYDDLAFVDRGLPGHLRAERGGRNQPAIRMPFSRSIRLEQVRYRYPTGGEDALGGIDCEIRKGESVGIVGTTGAGKSTLVDAILGLLDPAGGRVLVDDVDIRSDLEGWQANLGVVPQTVYLMDATLRANIALGLREHEIDDDRITEAVRLAQLETFVAALPDGLETVVGERGIRISGGERQRVAIARALYRRPPVLVFDEGTSALDNLTEAELLRGLDTLRRDRTVIVVAHRLTTVRKCDRILLIESGRMADVGSFHELLQRNVAFRRLAVASAGAEVRESGIA